jgi:hypothetical protein
MSQALLPEEVYVSWYNQTMKGRKIEDQNMNQYLFVKKNKFIFSMSKD